MYQTVPGTGGWNANPSPATHGWMGRRSRRRQYFSNSRLRQAVRDSLKRDWNRPRSGLPFEYRTWNYFLYNSGLQNHAVLCHSRNVYANAETILDPNTWAPDLSLANFRVSTCERYLAYAASARAVTGRPGGSGELAKTTTSRTRSATRTVTASPGRAPATASSIAASPAPRIIAIHGRNPARSCITTGWGRPRSGTAPLLIIRRVGGCCRPTPLAATGS